MTFQLKHERLKKNLSALIMMIILAGGVFGCDRFIEEINGDTGGGGSDTLMGKPAPEFALEMMGGSIESLSLHKGEPVVMAFWSPWCGFCKNQAPLLSNAHAAFKDKGVVFIGVVTKGDYDTARAYINQYGHLFKNGIDSSGELSRSYQVAGTPKTVFIGRDGSVSYTHLGPISDRKLTREIKKIL